MSQQGLPGVFRTTRLKTATCARPQQVLQGREEKLIAAHQPGRKAGRKGGALFN
jgi:hypothetical protein